MAFAKAPVAGRVKTRLIPLLGESGATALHEQLAWRSISEAVAASLCPVTLWCSPTRQHAFFSACSEQLGVPLSDQHGGDLGARMAHAFEKTLHESSYALIMGSDCPVLNRHYLHEALSALHAGYDAVLGPAEDGGYVLLGLRRFNSLLFEAIPWGEAQVLDATRARLRQLQWRCHELPVLWDVDRPEDVARAMAMGIVPHRPVCIGEPLENHESHER